MAIVKWLRKVLKIHEHKYDWQRPNAVIPIYDEWGAGYKIGVDNVQVCIYIDPKTGRHCPKMKVKRYYY